MRSRSIDRDAIAIGRSIDAVDAIDARERQG